MERERERGRLMDSIVAHSFRRCEWGNSRKCGEFIQQKVD